MAKEAWVVFVQTRESTEYKRVCTVRGTYDKAIRKARERVSIDFASQCLVAFPRGAVPPSLENAVKMQRLDRSDAKQSPAERMWTYRKLLRLRPRSKQEDRYPFWRCM